MNSGFLLRGRDVTTLVCALWGSVFAGIGLATMWQSGPFSPIRWYGETMSDAVGRSLWRQDFAHLGLSSGGHTLGLFEVIGGGLLLAAALIYVRTRAPDPDCDRFHPLFALAPVAAIVVGVLLVLSLSHWQAGAAFVPVYLALAAMLSLLITPVLMTICGVPVGRRRILAAMQQPIEIANWHTAKR